MSEPDATLPLNPLAHLTPDLIQHIAKLREDAQKLRDVAADLDKREAQATGEMHQAMAESKLTKDDEGANEKTATLDGRVKELESLIESLGLQQREKRELAETYLATAAKIESPQTYQPSKTIGCGIALALLGICAVLSFWAHPKITNFIEGEKPSFSQRVNAEGKGMTIEDMAEATARSMLDRAIEDGKKETWRLKTPPRRATVIIEEKSYDDWETTVTGGASNDTTDALEKAAVGRRQ